MTHESDVQSLKTQGKHLAGPNSNKHMDKMAKKENIITFSRQIHRINAWFHSILPTIPVLKRGIRGFK